MNGKENRIIRFIIDTPGKITITQGYNIINSFPVHFHYSFTIGLLESGSRRFSYRNEESDLKKGDVFIIQPFEPHSCRAINGEQHTYKILSFEKFDCFDNPYFDRLVIEAAEIADKLREFHALAEYERGSLKINKLIAEIRNNLLAFAAPAVEYEKGTRLKSVIKKAKDFIEENCLEEMTLRDAAEKAGMSEFHFNRVFHELIGISPYAYLIFCRVKKSQDILIEGGSVTKTAYETGFFDQSHFIRLFRKHVGVTPGAFLKNNRLNKSDKKKI